MSGPTHGGKGDDRRPETAPGAYAQGFDAIDWTARDRSARGPDVSDGHDREGFPGGCARFGCQGGDNCVATTVPDIPNGGEA